MTNLIPINYDNDRQTVSAKALYDFLELDKSQWARWYRQNIEADECFTERIDYIPLDMMSNGNQTKDFQLTIEMAKELSMLARTPKGKQARQYFIELEKQWNSPEAVMARALKMADNKILALQNNVSQLQTALEEQKPLVLFAETCIASNDSLLVREVAKLASKQGIIIGEKRLWQKLREWEVVSPSNEPYQRAFDAGWFETRRGTYNTPYGSEAYSTYKVTPKGQIYIIEKLKKENAA